MRYLPYVISALVVISDQLTKRIVIDMIEIGQRYIVIPGILDLVHVKNSGMVFGIMQGNNSTPFQLLMICISIFAIVVLIYWIKNSHSEGRQIIYLSLILGGAIGNLIDRIVKGAVVDFVDIHIGSHHWPAFNFADSTITLGIVFLVVDMLFKEI